MSGCFHAGAVPQATSDSHTNNEGSHDASGWGALWVRA